VANHDTSTENGSFAFELGNSQGHVQWYGFRSSSIAVWLKVTWEQIPMIFSPGLSIGSSFWRLLDAVIHQATAGYTSMHPRMIIDVVPSWYASLTPLLSANKIRVYFFWCLYVYIHVPDILLQIMRSLATYLQDK